MKIEVAKEIVAAVKGYVERSVKALTDRLQDIERQLAELPKPENGKDGRNAYEVAVSLGYEGSVHDWMESLRGAPGESIKGAPGADGKDGLDGKDGRDGVDGKGITIEDVRPLIAEAAKAIPLPRDGIDGKDGINGADGKSVTVDDVSEFMEAAMAKWALEFERRASDLIQRCIDRIEKPKDGAPGKDGRDAFNLDDIRMALGDDGRTLTLAWTRGDERVERAVTLPVPIYRGVYKPGEKYSKGDTVTFGGSTWSAARDTESKPETDDSWRLCVKRGRDGKDGLKGDKGDRGPAGKKEEQKW